MTNSRRRASEGNSSRRRRRTASEAGMNSSSGDSGDGARARRRARRALNSEGGPEVEIPQIGIPPSVEEEPPTGETAGGDAGVAPTAVREEEGPPGTHQEQEGGGGHGLEDSEDGLRARRGRRCYRPDDGDDQIGAGDGAEAISNGIDLLAGNAGVDPRESGLDLDSDDDDDSSEASNSRGRRRRRANGGAGPANATVAGPTDLPALDIQEGDHEDEDQEEEDQLTPHQASAKTGSPVPAQTQD